MAEQGFSGDQETKLDGKGRTSIPAAFRAQLKSRDLNSFYAYPSRHEAGVLECCDVNQMNNMKTAMNRLSPLSATRRNLELAIFSRAHEIVFDGDGRTVIPKALRNAAGLEEGPIYFRGRAQTFEIWSSKVFEASQDVVPVLSDEDLAAFDDVWQGAMGTGGQAI